MRAFVEIFKYFPLDSCSFSVMLNGSGVFPDRQRRRVMSTRTNIPETARLILWGSGLIPLGEWAGKRVDWQVYSGHASKGYRSGYERVPHTWFTVRVEGQRPRTWSYSGKRWLQSVRDCRQNWEDFGKQGGSLTVHVDEPATASA